jgi:hypothetical protein
VVVLVATAAVVVVLTTGESDEESEATLVQNVRLEHEGAAGTEADSGEAQGEEATAESQHQNSPGDLGGEAPRQGPRSPVGEQVEDRAYPKSYVSDRVALQGAKDFKSLPSAAPANSFKSAADFRAASRGSSQQWKALGPVTPDVAAEATQFFNTQTSTGTPTTNSGRVTAMAIDPNCGKKRAGCRAWVAAAGGGVWRTPDALAQDVKWKAPSQKLPTNSFGSLYVDPNDKSGDTIYAGSGEPNGSGDSEAGLGLFRSSDGGKTWKLVNGSRSVAIDRSIGTIAVKPNHPNVIYIGTDLARHGSSSVNGGRRTPPNAPALGVYKSTDNGRHFRLMTDLQRQTPANPTPPSTGVDWFQGGVNKLMIDPNNTRRLYAAVFGYGVWRSNNGGKTWRQIFHTVNETDFSNPSDPGDTFGDRTEFDLFNKKHHTGIYVGDSSDDLGVAEVWRVKKADTKPATDLLGNGDNAGWTKLSSSQNGTNGFLSYYYCQNGQCGYDDFVESPPGHPGQLWLGGSMNYDELPLYGGLPPRSNGRAVIRSTNASAPASQVTWQDMTQDARPPGATEGMHPDEHAIVFDPKNSAIALVGSDGGVIRVNLKHPADDSSQCAQRRYDYGSGPQPLEPADLKDCQSLLDGIPSRLDSLNKGLNTIQFQSLSVNPSDPKRQLLGGTQDNGTFFYRGKPTWTEVVGGDGAQSGFNPDDGSISYHTYYDATPGVNFDNNDPKQWYDTYDPLQASPENRSFYTPFIVDPNVGGRLFIGMQHVWRTDDNGGSEAYLKSHDCNTVYFNPSRPGCGDWVPIGQDLTSPSFGNRAGEYVVATTRATSDDKTLWAGTRIGRVLVSKNADARPVAVNFTRIDTNKTPGRFVSGIAVDPNDPNHAVISYSGYNVYTPGTPGHVFDVHFDPSTGKATFKDISNNLGDQPVTGIVLVPSSHGTAKGGFGSAGGDIYVSTDFGVSKLSNGSTKWVDAAPGMPAVATYGLTYSPEANRIYAATHGRGAYFLRVG